MNRSPGEMPYRVVGNEALRDVLGETGTVTTATPFVGWWLLGCSGWLEIYFS